MPKMAFIGVRNSWLMLARNRLLASLALSAAALACKRAPLRAFALANIQREEIELPFPAAWNGR